MALACFVERADVGPTDYPLTFDRDHLRAVGPTEHIDELGDVREWWRLLERQVFVFAGNAVECLAKAVHPAFGHRLDCPHGDLYIDTLRSVS